MTRRLTLGCLCAAAILAVGCGSNPRAELPSPTAPPPATAPVSVSLTPPSDPVAALIAESDRHFENGRRQLELGHLEQAKAEFDRALEVLLRSADGARTEPRLREHFDRLVDRISAFEMTALAQGDGFAEKKYEPATIDELLEITTFDRPDADADTHETVEADLQNTTHDIPIPLNQKVLSYVELFQNRLRDFLAEGLQRGTRYLPMIQSVFRAEGLPLDLAYIPLIESAFKPNALSRAKAKGVWQFMRGTALENGLKQDWYIDERSDPEKSTYAAAKYLKTLHGIFNGDWHLAMASYNGGPGRVQRALTRSRLDDFWELTKSTRYLPRETREYVPMILAAIIIAKNPSQYGFEVAPEPPVTYEKVAVPRAIDLRRVAEWTGSSIDDIQALNPELRRWTTPLRYPEYEIKVPVGTAGLLTERIQSTSPDEFVSLNWYSVRKGESLSTIAKKLRVSRTDLAEANNLTTRSRVKIGQELVIPRAPTAALSARVDRTAPPNEVIAAAPISGVGEPTPDTKKTTPPEAVVATNGGADTELAKVVYRVKRGDTLFSIARLFKTTVAALKSWNRLRSNIITPGDRLTIFSKPSEVPFRLRPAS
jgi:membrane-bound lytic murein transglycosylase D